MRKQFIVILLLCLVLSSNATNLHKNHRRRVSQQENSQQSQHLKHHVKQLKPTRHLNKLNQDIANQYATNIQMSIEKEEGNPAGDVEVVDESQAQQQQAKQTQKSQIEELAWQSANFEEFYSALKKFLNDHLDNLKSQLREKSNQCQSFDADIEAFTKKVEKGQEYIKWLQSRIAENNGKMDKIFNERCEAHNIFIDYYKNSKITLRLINYLRVAIQNYNFVQLKQVGAVLAQLMDPVNLANPKLLKQILSQLKENDVPMADKFDETGKSLENKQNSRSNEQIGQKHVDDNRERIDVDEFESSERRLLDSYKSEIFQILNNLSEKINSEIDRRQNDEIELNDRVIKYVEKLEIENQSLEKEIEITKESIRQSKIELDVLVFQSETCKGEQQWIEDVVAAQEEIIKDVVDNKDRIQEEYNALKSTKSVGVEQTGGQGGNGQGQGGVNSVKFTSEPKDYGDTENWKEDSGVKYELVDGGSGIKLPIIALTGLRVGLSWVSPTDLDSSFLVTDENYQIIDLVWWDKLVSDDQAIFHNDDARDGSAVGEGDDESIDIYLNRISEKTQRLFLLVQAYDDNTQFQDVAETHASIYVNQKVFCTYNINPEKIPDSTDATTVILVEFYKNQSDGGAWYIKSTGLWVHYDSAGNSIRTAENTNLKDILSIYGKGEPLPSYVSQYPRN